MIQRWVQSELILHQEKAKAAFKVALLSRSLLLAVP
jgi:hypothetical protein